MTAMIVGAVVIGVVAIVLVATSLGSSSSPSSSNGRQNASSTSGAAAHRHRAQSHTQTQSSESSTPSVSPAETQVAVLNGTNTTGLAHRLAAGLQQSGYSQATPLDGTPPGSHQTTVVEYGSGHRAEAEGVAHALSVSTVQPLEASVTPLVGGSTVVVIAGMDKAGPTGETGSSSSGEAASSGEASQSGEAAP